MTWSIRRHLGRGSHVGPSRYQPWSGGEATLSRAIPRWSKRPSFVALAAVLTDRGLSNDLRSDRIRLTRRGDVLTAMYFPEYEATLPDGHPLGPVSFSR